jgi:hypothetical protein
MWEDPIVEEVRQIREKHAANFDFDLDKIFADLKEKQIELHHKVVSFIDGKYVIVEEIENLVS